MRMGLVINSEGVELTRSQILKSLKGGKRVVNNYVYYNVIERKKENWELKNEKCGEVNEINEKICESSADCKYNYFHTKFYKRRNQ